MLRSRLFAGIAAILMFIYISAFVIIAEGVLCAGLQEGNQCQAYRDGTINDGIKLALNGIGGLISATVIAELALTSPGEELKGHVVTGDGPTPLSKAVVRICTGTWLLTGGLAFFIGVMLDNHSVPPLTDMGVAWLGLAVAALYSYLGVRPPTTPAAVQPLPAIGGVQPPTPPVVPPVPPVEPVPPI